MYVGVAWVHPWPIALEGEYIRSILIIMVTYYDCIRVDFMDVGVDPYVVVCMLLYKG